LKPADLAKGNGALFHDVDNRGDKRLLVQFNSAQSSNDPATPEHAGNGLLMRHGFTVTWSGWMPGLPATNNKVRLDVPVAVGAPSAIEGTVWDEFVGSLTASRPAVGRAPGSRSPLSGFR
jgi:hypothetical protein